ncbi:MAG: hypothetical protein WC940_02740 [Candidatus Paceibacterota bacterium]|jgi:hypothetical protein
MTIKDIVKVKKLLAEVDEFYSDNYEIFEEIVELLNQNNLDLKLIQLKK